MVKKVNLGNKLSPNIDRYRVRGMSTGTWYH